MVEISVVKTKNSIAEDIMNLAGGKNELIFWWLGQAGFAFRYGNSLGLIDPYLSDYLAKKYKGKELPHKRLMPAPIKPEDLRNLNIVLCTHRHSDHMDPETLPVLAKNNPRCRFIAPRAELQRVISMGLPENLVSALNAGESLFYNKDIKIEAVASAHEEIEVNEKGEHHFLGFILKIGGITIYHSGDCVTYQGLEGSLKNAEIDVALLPINGRDEYRRQRNILGNFAFSEAVRLCRHCKIPLMIAHHFGMFDFNSVDVNEISRQAENLENGIKCFLPRADMMYIISKQR